MVFDERNPLAWESWELWWIFVVLLFRARLSKVCGRFLMGFGYRELWAMGF